MLFFNDFLESPLNTIIEGDAEDLIILWDVLLITRYTVKTEDIYSI